jgi:putative SbcD/Mre11-related phosphoesterase
VQPYPALLLRTRTERMLVIADLHIGWEIALAQEGIHVPSQTPKILTKLLGLIDLCKPTSLLLLGDVKHTIAKVELEEWQDVPSFFEALLKKVSDIKVVLGNHDGNLEPLLPENVKLLPSTGIAIEEAGFFHGNAWPAPEILACRSLVMGHVHPTVAFKDHMGFRITAQVWVKAKLNGELLAKAFLKSQGVQVEGKANTNAVKLLYRKANVRLKASELFIMPYFNDFLGGRPINRSGRDRYPRSIEYLGPVLRSGSVDFDNAETYLLDGTFLGTVKQLKSLS